MDAVTSRKPTLTDVAARAGVSTTTASYILNGRSSQMRISRRTETRVRAVAAELAYRPNRSARNLRTASTATLGLLSDAVAAGPHAGQMLRGASSAARELGLLLLIAESGGDRDTERRLLEEMQDRQVDGVLYASVVHARVVAPPVLGRLPAVLLNCRAPGRSLPSVVPAEVEGGRAAVAALLADERVREVTVVGVDPDPLALAGPLRLEGIAAELAARGLPPGGSVECAWTVADARRAVSGLLARGARPAGLVCLSDRIAMGSYQALAAHGLHVPGDVSVVSFDGSPLAGWLQPEVTSVALPLAQMGRAAVHRLLATGGPDEVLVPMPVQQGGSVAGATTAVRQ